MTFPENPIAAVSHLDPYAYYEQLVAERPIYRDDSLGVWIATSAGAVREVLTSDLCRVRPPSEPVSTALVGTTAGRIFGLLARFTDGEPHHRTKRAVSAALSAIEEARVEHEAARWARHALQVNQQSTADERLSTFSFDLSSHVIGSLLGIPNAKIGQATEWLRHFVRAISPGATEDEIERGLVAADCLWELFQGLLDDASETSLLSGLAREMSGDGIPRTDLVIANGIGFLFQAYDAGAGLIGSTLFALSRDPEHSIQVVEDPARLRRLVLEVIHRDPPAQNTRRWVVRDGLIAGQEMRMGDAILVVLAAANRDLAPPSQSFSFGLGVHACTGQAIAVAIAQAGVKQLIEEGFLESLRTARVTYRGSINVRIPEFHQLRGECLRHRDRPEHDLRKHDQG